MRAKSFLFLLLCLVAHHGAIANAIDSIRTKEDVVKFISTHKFATNDPNEWLFSSSNLFRPKEIEVDSGRTDSERKTWREIYTSFASNDFYKMDIDGDGKTDLVVDGHTAFVIMDKGTVFEAHYVGQCNDSFINSIQLPDGAKALLYKRVVTVDTRCDRWRDSVYIDTLVFKFNNFVEYNRHPKHIGIKRVALYKEPNNFGDNEDVYFEVNKKGFATYCRRGGEPYAVDFSFSYIDSEQLNDFWGLIEYMDTSSLKKDYQNLLITEMPMAWLNIYFENGSVKKIRDYGFWGTIGLRSLYNTVSGWERVKSWQKWTTSSAHTDSMLVESAITFFGYLPNDMDFPKMEVSSSFTKYEVKRPNYNFRLGEDRFTLILFPNHHYVFTYSLTPPHDFSDSGVPDNLFSIGTWRKSNSAIILNWDGYKTLRTTKDKKEWAKYFEGEVQPVPLRIENWQLIFKGNNTLHGGYKIARDIFRDK